MKVVDLVTHTSGLTYGFMMRTSVDAAYRKLKIDDFQTPGGLDAMIEQLSDAAAGVLAGHAVELLGLDRRDGLPRPEALGHELRRVPAHPAVRAAGHDRHRLLRARRRSSTASPPATSPSQGGGLKLQDDGQKSTYADAARAGIRRRRPGLDHARLHALLPHDAERRHAGRRADPQPQDGRAVQPEPPAGRQANWPTWRRRALFSEAGYSGIGFSIGCGVNIDVAKTRLPGTLGEYFWGGAASTAFWIDPKEELAVVFMTQVMGTDARLTLRRDLRTLVYSAMTESYAG